MTRRLLVFWLFAALLAGVCLAGRAAAAGLEGFEGLSGELRIVGCEPGLVPVRLLAEKVMAAHPGVKIAVTTCPMGAALSRVRSGTAQLALFERDPLPAQLGQGRFLVTLYAVDPVAVAVNPVNPVDTVSLAQARELFAGRIRNWSEVGGKPDMVLPAIVDATVTDGPGLGRDTQPKLTSLPALRLNLSRNKEFLALLSVRDLEAAVKPLRLDGVEPSRENFLAGRYRVYRYLRLISEQTPTGLSRAFLDLMLGPEGQRAVEEAGYLPLARRPAQPSLLNADSPEGLLSGN